MLKVTEPSRLANLLAMPLLPWSSVRGSFSPSSPSTPLLHAVPSLHYTRTVNQPTLLPLFSPPNSTPHQARRLVNPTQQNENLSPSPSALRKADDNLSSSPPVFPNPSPDTYAIVLLPYQCSLPLPLHHAKSFSPLHLLLTLSISLLLPIPSHSIKIVVDPSLLSFRPLPLAQNRTK